MSTLQMEKVIRHVLVGNASGITDALLFDSFLATNDQAAFEALVRRHGPMVLAVCRRVLKNRHDAEDAFQATFLVLVRKASSIRKPDLLANWLYGVAHRTAMKARTASARRRTRESRVDAMAQPESTAPDLLARLDEELAQLPEKYRAPVVLCDLEGLTRLDAAKKLGWPVGTVNWRLAKARAMLANRLNRKGVSLSVGAVAVALSGESASASVSPSLVAETVKAGTTMASGATGGLISSAVLALTEGVVKAMLLEKLKLGTMLLLAFILVGGAGMLGARGTLATGEAEKEPTEAEPMAEPPKKEDTLLLTGNFRVEAPTEGAAAKIGVAAERYRKEKALEWLGHELPDWPERCPIRVTLRVSDSTGMTSFAFDEGKVLDQVMTLEGSLDRILKVELPHEMTHVVLAHHFGSPTPRWADEGAAVLSSAKVEQRHYEKELKKVLSEPGRMISLQRLFPRTDYPTDVMALYAEGCSVTRFLVEAKDRKTFLKFIAAGKQDGWDEAVERYYGYANVDALEKAWLRSVAIETNNKPTDDAELFHRKLQRAFGKDGDDIRKAPIKLDVPSRRWALAAGTFEILKDGRIKLSPCWYASFDKETTTTIRCEEAHFTLNGSITTIAELSRRKIVAIEPSGAVRITFRPAEPDADAVPPRP